MDNAAHGKGKDVPLPTLPYLDEKLHPRDTNPRVLEGGGSGRGIRVHEKAHIKQVIIGVTLNATLYLVTQSVETHKEGVTFHEPPIRHALTLTYLVLNTCSKLLLGYYT